MAKVTIDLSVESVKQLLLQLPPQDIQTIFKSLQERMETFQMMRLAEPSFEEWNSEDDMYSNE